MPSFRLCKYTRVACLDACRRGIIPVTYMRHQQRVRGDHNRASFLLHKLNPDYCFSLPHNAHPASSQGQWAGRHLWRRQQHLQDTAWRRKDALPGHRRAGSPLFCCLDRQRAVDRLAVETRKVAGLPAASFQPSNCQIS